MHRKLFRIEKSKSMSCVNYRWKMTMRKTQMLTCQYSVLILLSLRTLSEEDQIPNISPISINSSFSKKFGSKKDRRENKRFKRSGLIMRREYSLTSHLLILNQPKLLEINILETYLSLTAWQGVPAKTFYLSVKC